VRGLQARDAEVADLRRAHLADEDVAGLDVAVDDAARVRELEALEDLHQDLGKDLELRTVAGDQVIAEAAAHHALHRDERVLVVLAVLVDRDDARVVEVAGRLRLALEALERVLGVLRVEVALADDLQRDVAADHRVVALVDDAHPAPAELADDLVLADARGALHRPTPPPRSWRPPA
jgi:hypothetical protein